VTESVTVSDGRPVTRFDLNDRSLGDRQPEVLARLREQCPVGYSTRYGGFWHLSRYGECLRAARDYQRFTTARGLLIPPSGASIRVIPPEIEPPEHTTYRKMLMAYFSTGAAEAYEPLVTEIITRTLASFAAKGEADLAKDFAVQIPPLVITGVFGIEPEYCEEMRALGEQFLETQVSEDLDAKRAAGLALEKWVQDRIDERLGGPPVDVLARIVNSEIDGEPMPTERILGMIRVLIMAGHETTIHSIASLLYRVAATPGVRERLLADRSLVQKAVDESLRLDSPVLYLGRTLTEDVEVGGQSLGKDERIALLYAAANRDPERFTDPDVFDLDRDARSHLAFGSGRHRCLGEHLAALEMRVAMNVVLDTIPDYRVAPGAEVGWGSGGVSCGVTSLPVIFSPAVTPAAGT
jgi:cytochrome P450